MSIRAATVRKPPRRLTFKVSEGRVRERNGTFHLIATVRVSDRTRRVRQSLHIKAERSNIEAATVEAERLLKLAREALGGVARKSFAENVANYLKRAPGEELGATDVAVIKQLTAHFGTRRMYDIAPAEFVQFVDDRQRGNAAATRERYLNTVTAFLNVAIAAGQYPEMPLFKRNAKARNPATRARREVDDVTSEVISALRRSMHIATETQIAVEEATGARVSSVLHGCTLGDLDLTPGRIVLLFRKTKNGDDVPAALPESLRTLLNRYLAWRHRQVRAGRVGPGSDGPLFLTPKGDPYRDNGARWGTQNRTAFNAAKKRAAGLLAQEYDAAIVAAVAADRDGKAAELRRRRADDLRVLQRLTQHWFRHKLATDLGRKDPRAAMAQGGWKDVRSLHGYMRYDAEYQRELVEKRGIADTNLTRNEVDDGAKQLAKQLFFGVNPPPW